MARTLTVGSLGGDVAALQDALNQVGTNAALPEQRTALPLLVPDGAFGTKTQVRVKDFQNKNGLVGDGIVGPLTLGRLQELADVVQPGMSTSRPAGGVGGGGGAGGGGGSAIKWASSTQKTQGGFGGKAAGKV
jgi:peptidoglycan hydrolase-like protein with peptidoglycan-binding domain